VLCFFFSSGGGRCAADVTRGRAHVSARGVEGCPPQIEPITRNSATQAWWRVLMSRHSTSCRACIASHGARRCVVACRLSSQPAFRSPRSAHGRDSVPVSVCATRGPRNHTSRLFRTEPVCSRIQEAWEAHAMPARRRVQRASTQRKSKSARTGALRARLSSQR